MHRSFRRSQARAAHASLLLFALLVARPRAEAQEARAARPPSGIGGIVVGWAGVGWTVLNLGTLPVCFAEFYPDRARTACIASSISLGTGGLIAAAIGLGIGYPRRAAYKQWRRLDGAQVALTRLPRGAQLQLQIPIGP